MSLIAEIESACTDSKVPIVDLLRKCKIIASRLQHQELSDWINSELNGYKEGSAIPEYRLLHLNNPIGHFNGPFGSGLKNAPIPLGNVPDEIRETITPLKMMQPIAEIEELSSKQKTLQSQWSGDIIAYFQHHVPIYQGMVLSAAHWNISSASLKGIIDTVRTRLLDYVLTIQSQYPEIDNIKPGSPSPVPDQVLHQTFNTTIMGGFANVGSGKQDVENSAANYSVTNTLNNQEVTNLLQQLKVAANSLNANEKIETTQALQNVENQLKQKKPDLNRIKSYLEIAGHITKLAPVAKQIFDLIKSQIS